MHIIHITPEGIAAMAALDRYDREADKPEIWLHGTNGQRVIAMPVDSYTLPDSEYRVLTDGITPPRQPATAHIQ